MTNEVNQKFDVIQSSIDHLLTVSFSKNSSTVYPLAVNIAKGAARYAEANIGRKLVHFVAFSKTREDAGRAIALVNYVSSWKATQVFTGGKPVRNAWQVTSVLECYLEASASKDWTAHCHYIIDDPFIEEPEGQNSSLTWSLSEKPQAPKQALEIDRYVFPCKFLWEERFEFQIDHPAKPDDQIQAGAVKFGCNWCPNFESEAFKKIGMRKISRDIFT